jgi:very-short-patch-repair endonuclease
MPHDFHEKHPMGANRGGRERALAELAARQHGVIALRQLREIGFTRRMVQRRLEDGRLYRQQPRVYSLLPSLELAAARMKAAVSSCEPGALSHRAGAAVWDLGPWPTGTIDVSATGNRRPRRGVRVHVVENLVVVEKDGFAVTSAMRTLADLAGTESRPAVERAYEQAERLGLLDVTKLERECEGRRGSRILKRLISEEREAPPSKNELERVFLDLCRDNALPLPSQNVTLHGYEVDNYWAEAHLVVELDGYEWHRTRAAFEADRARDAALAATGIRVLRFTWRQVTRQPELVADAVASSSTAPSRGSSAGGTPPRSVPAISSSGAFSSGMKPDFMPK